MRQLPCSEDHNRGSRDRGRLPGSYRRHMLQHTPRRQAKKEDFMGKAPGQTPLFYRVEEAAEILRISRSSAYEMANAWLRSDGAHGLPCLRLGRRIVVPRMAIDDWAMIGSDQDRMA